MDMIVDIIAILVTIRSFPCGIRPPERKEAPPTI
jgi:hypothetical protein